MSGSSQQEQLAAERHLETQMSDTFEHIKQYSDQFEESEQLFGFNARALYERGALQLPVEISIAAQPSTLEIEILRVFRIENWDKRGKEVYRILEPALRLTTHFLTNSAVSSYWHTLCCGRREVEYNSRQEFQSIRIAESRSWSLRCEKHLSEFFETLVDKISFGFDDEIGKDGTSAIYQPRLQLSAKMAAETPDSGENVRFCKDFHTTARRFCGLGHLDVAAVLRFNFAFAASMLHELAHCLEEHRESEWRKRGRGAERIEAHYGVNTWNEADHRWGSCFKDMAPNGDARTPRRFISIGMRYIWTLQQKSTWQRRDLTAEDFKVPHDGATGWYIPALSELFVHEGSDDTRPHHDIEGIEDDDDNSGDFQDC